MSNTNGSDRRFALEDKYKIDDEGLIRIGKEKGDKMARVKIWIFMIILILGLVMGCDEYARENGENCPVQIKTLMALWSEDNNVYDLFIRTVLTNSSHLRAEILQWELVVMDSDKEIVDTINRLHDAQNPIYLLPYERGWFDAYSECGAGIGGIGYQPNWQFNYCVISIEIKVEDQLYILEKTSSDIDNEDGFFQSRYYH